MDDEPIFPDSLDELRDAKPSEPIPIPKLKPVRDYAAELDELRDYIKELQGNVVWLKKALETHEHHVYEANIESSIEYDSRQPTKEYGL